MPFNFISPIERQVFIRETCLFSWHFEEKKTGIKTIDTFVYR